MRQFILTTPFNVETKGNDVFLDGFISTIDQDLVNDIVTPNCLKSMLEQIRDRNIKLDLEHEAFKGSDNESTEIAKTKIPVGRLMDGTEDGKRLRVKGMLNRHHNRFSETKGSIIDGFLDAFSIAYIPTRVWHEEKNGETIRMLDDVKLLNVALTGNPVNTSAQIRDIVMKSIDSVDEKGLNKPEDYVEKKPKKKVSDDSIGAEAIPEKVGDDKGKKKGEDEDEDKTKKRYKRYKKGDIIEEYKDDPNNAEKLEVKGISDKPTTRNGEAYIERTILLKSHSPNGVNNQKEVKEMAEEETTTPESNDAESGNEGDAGNSTDNESSEASESGAETKSQEIASLKAEVSELKETVDKLLKAKDVANSKAISEKKSTQEAQVEPLDLLS